MNVNCCCSISWLVHYFLSRTYAHTRDRFDCTTHPTSTETTERLTREGNYFNISTDFHGDFSERHQKVAEITFDFEIPTKQQVEFVDLNLELVPSLTNRLRVCRKIYAIFIGKIPQFVVASGIMKVASLYSLLTPALIFQEWKNSLNMDQRRRLLNESAHLRALGKS